MARTRIVTIVASDFGDSSLAQGLERELVKAGISCNLFVGRGQTSWTPDMDTMKAAIDASSLVLLSMSETCAVEIFAGGYAIRQGKPLALMPLSFGQLRKEAYIPFRPHVCLVFVLNNKEIVEATRLYTNANIIVTGHPEWERFGFPQQTKWQMRETLKVAPNKRLILVSGEKEASINFPLAANVIEAVANMPDPELFEVIFTIHPGHFPIPGGGDLRAFYGELERYHPDVSVKLSCKATPFGIGTPDMVVGADLVIGTNSTVQIQAGYLGIPAIAVLLRPAFRDIILPRRHESWWEPCDRGAIAPVYGLDSDRTTHLIKLLLTAEGFAPMREAQRQLFQPPPYVGYAYENMVTYTRISCQH